MMKKLFILLLMFSLSAQAQTKKPGNTKGKGKGKNIVTPDSTIVQEEEPELDPMEKLELELPPETEIDPITGKKVFYKERKLRNDSMRAAMRKKIKQEKLSFWVKTKHPKPKSKERTQLCINIANRDTNLTYCMKDSVLKDPEVTKILFERTKGDTTYMLIYIDAYSKAKLEGGLCNGKKETKLVFARWNYKTNVAKWKQKNIASCVKGITNMTKEPIVDWDKSAPLVVSYHRGSNFYDITFDPEKPELGFQTPKAEKEE